MKKQALSGLLFVLLLCATLLAGCGAEDGALHEDAPSIADTGVAHPDLEPEDEDPDSITALIAAGAPYDLAGNRHNGQTALMDGAILAQELGMLYRVDTATGEAVVLLDNESLGYRLPGPPALTVFDGHIYFWALKEMHGDADTGYRAEFALLRGDSMGNHITEVATSEQGVFSLIGYDGYLVAWQELYEAPFGPASCRIFLPDGEGDTLEEIPPERFDDAWFAALEARIYFSAERGEVYARMGYGNMGAPFASTVRANDAYYVLDGASLYRLPFGEGEAVPVPLADEAAQALREDGSRRLASVVNYDADWLYLHQDYSLYRLRKDGSALEPLVKGGVRDSWRIDVTQGYVFYTGSSGKLYMYSLETGEATRLDPAPEGETVEVTLVGDTLNFIVSPVLQADREALADEMKIHVGGGGQEIVDGRGNLVHFTTIETGARLTVEYTEFVELEGWDYPSLYAYKIIVHE